MAANESISGMITKTTQMLYDNLKTRYDSGFPILKELIQNANDAKASVLKITKTDGLKEAKHPLLQKPGLIVFNNGLVKTPEDLEGIESFGEVAKLGRTGVIGKFGLGMKSIFHFCDMFFYIAYQKNQKEIVHAVNPYFDYIKQEDRFHKDWNLFELSDQKLLLDSVTEIVKDSNDGLLLWIPLRDGSYKHTITKDIYNINDIWKLSDEELKESIALSLASLDISISCSNGTRTLEKIELTTQKSLIELELKKEECKIYSQKEIYCEIKKTEPVGNVEGEKLLKTLISKDKFAKVSYLDENGDEVETCSYTENQKVALAIVKFINKHTPYIKINWSSYLPLNGEDDSEFYIPNLKSEYHILAHANFAIDSGRKNIIKFNECVDKNIKLYPDFDDVDDKSAQVEWNKILIRYFILPELLKFCSEKGEKDFFEGLYYSLASEFEKDLGYFCFDKGIAFDNGIKWEYHKTNSITDSGMYLINQTAKKYSNKNAFTDFESLKSTIKICNYIQTEEPDINWSISVAEKSLTLDDLVLINRIITEKQYPILLLPNIFEKEYLNDSYRLSNYEIAINFLEEFESVLKEKASDIFESLCSNGSITKEVSRAIFTNERIKKYVKLFKVTSLDPEETKYNSEGKTFDEICALSNNSQLFFYVAQNDSKQERELQPIYLLQRMCPNITFYCAGRATAKNQLFLKEDDKDSIYKYITETDLNNQGDTPEIKLLDSIKIESILYAMKQNLEFLEFGDVPVADEFISRTKYLSEEQKKQYFDVLRSILLGKVTQDNFPIYKLIYSIGQDSRANLFYSIISKYSETEYNKHVIRNDFDYPQSLIDVLKIKEITVDELEEKLGTISSEISDKATTEERILLAKNIYNENVFQKLDILKTITGEFVRLDCSSYKCYLESRDENIRFPGNYVFPNTFKLIRKDNTIALQNCIPELTYEVLLNTILEDESNELGSQEGIRLSNFVCSLIEKSKGKIKLEDLSLDSRKRKWIPDYSYKFYALNEVIDCLGINEELISLCSGIIHANKINQNYFICRNFFVKEKDEALRQLLSHPDKSSENKWPWFNIQSFPILRTNEVAKDFLPLILKTGDSSIRITSEILKDNEEGILEVLRTINQDLFVSDSDYISNHFKNFIIQLGKEFQIGTNISEDLLSFIEEIFNYINEHDILDILEQAKNEKDEHTIKLPSEASSWNSISNLANFKETLPDLKKENTLSRRISSKFPANERRFGVENNGTEIKSEELINKLEICKNPKLWGVFCYLIFNDDSKLKLIQHGRLIEENTISVLKGFHLSSIKLSKINVYTTENNYCKSLTSELIKLKDAKEMDTIFYNKPDFKSQTGEITVELFDNFSAFSEMSIENAIKQLLSVRTSFLPDESFFVDLANPSQTPLKTAINMIFANVFSTLKILKLDTRAGQYNQIALEYKRYMEACGNEDFAAMKSSCDAIRSYIENNNGLIQNQIKERVINYIREAEYQERCILFELFQNSDDAYAQKGSDSRTSYFNAKIVNDSMVIEHIGRPINEYKVGGCPEYKADLANMLTIGWSDKGNMHSYGRQTGKFGYGFKTVYLISDEPHIKSGDYDFIVKAALYPQTAGEGYTEKTIITLPLNENGLKKKDEIISDFEQSANFLVMFAKRVREINVNENSYSWKPKNKLELSNFIVESDGDILLFKTIPSHIQDPQCQFASLAFRLNGASVVPLEERIPKMWCLAPLSDFNGLNFAINADFKTNTGRQTLACENPDNQKLINKLSTLFVDSIFELKDDPIFGCYFNSLINIILDSKTKSKGFLANFSEYTVQTCLAKGILPNGTTDVIPYNQQNILALSAHPFGSHVSTQYKYINAMNDFINDCEETNYIVTTQILAELLPQNHGSQIVEIKYIITLLECLLNKYASNIQRQKEILLKLRDSQLFDYVIKEDKLLENCKITDVNNTVKMINRVAEISPNYGEAVSILSRLYKPDTDVLKQYLTDQNDEDDNEEDKEIEDDNTISFQEIPTVLDIYERWVQLSPEEWINKKEEYYSWMFPKQIDRHELKQSLIVGDDYWIRYDENNPSIPKSWCILFLLGILQSSVYYNHSEVSRRLRIERIDDLITMFCDGANLQEIYDRFLEKTQFAEEDLEEFERLLRVYKFRKHFMSFYNLFKTQTKGEIQSTGQILIPSSDSELSGSGIEAFASDRSLKFGISLIMRELQDCDFYEDKQKAFEKLNQFTYIPNKKLRRIVYQQVEPIYSTSEALYREIIKQLGDVPRLNDFLAEHDLPFIILGD